MKKFLYLLVFVLVASSCNKDEVITTDVEQFYRAKKSTSVAQWTTVFEYTHAPGQFINEPKTGGFTGDETTVQSAVNYAHKRMSDNLFVSLGGFGGYIVTGFDHSIDNVPGYDFAIKGNSFKGSSEPGIVWVMRDENGDGQPNDTWYELKGCGNEDKSAIQNYEVTYYRPESAGSPVRWSDNLGKTGEIDYLKAYHNQESYYPRWITSDSYTLKGTFLKPKNYDKSGNGTYWVQDEYDWGYADNFSAVDLYSSNDSELKGCNLFDISNAVDSNGTAVELTFVDFIKVQTACNTKSGWLGENSTEVFGFYDYTMVNSAN